MRISDEFLTRPGRSLAVLAGVAALVTATSTSASAQDTGSTRAFKFLMGTSVRIETSGGTPELRQQALDEAFAAIAEVDRIMSDYRDDSELTLVNGRAAARTTRISDPLLAVLDAALRVAEASGGAYDPTIRPLLVMSGVKSRQPHQPTASELAAVRPLVGYRGVTLDGTSRTVRFARSGMALDLSGIAHGFASEVASASLRRRGLSGLIDTGTTQFVVGLPVGKAMWTVGVGHPDFANRLLGAVDVTGGAVATVSASASGAGRFDPRTLQPATRSLSATVVSSDGTLAEALANAALVLGPRDGLVLLERFTGTWGLVTYRQGDGTVGIEVSPSSRRQFHPSR